MLMFCHLLKAWICVTTINKEKSLEELSSPAGVPEHPFHCQGSTAKPNHELELNWGRWVLPKSLGAFQPQCRQEGGLLTL